MHSTVGEALPTLELKVLVTLESRIWFYSEPVAEIARDIARFLLELDSNEKRGDGTLYPSLRDKYLVACKKDLVAMRKNV